MTSLAKEFYPNPPPQPALLALNFDGFATQGVSPFQGTNQDIQEILYRTAEVFAPFNVQVRRATGDGAKWGQAPPGNSPSPTTVFIGHNTSGTFTPEGSLDYPRGTWEPPPPPFQDNLGNDDDDVIKPNQNEADVAFVNPDGLSNAQIVSALIHEAGHTFGLADAWNVGAGPNVLNQNLGHGDAMSIDSPQVFGFSNETLDTSDFFVPRPSWVYWTWETEATPVGPVEVEVWNTDTVATQNSFTYLQTVLGKRPVGTGQDDFANVTQDKVVAAGFLAPTPSANRGGDGTMPSLAPWTTTNGSIERLGDYDVFQFAPATTQPMMLSVQANGSALVPSLLVFDFDPGTGLATPMPVNQVLNSGSPTSLVSFQATAGHTFRIVVGAVDGATSGAYQLKTFTASLDANGNLIATATPGDDNITLDCQGSDVSVTVNGTALTVPEAVLTGVTINAGAGQDIINILCTPPQVKVTANGGADDDTINVGGRPAGTSIAQATLDTIQGPLSVHGDGNRVGGADRLFVFDGGAAAGKDYTVTSSTINRTPGATATITYDTVEKLELDTSAFADSIDVRSTRAKTDTTVKAGEGDDTIHVGQWIGWPVPGFTLDAIQGTLHVLGQGGLKDAVTVEDEVNALASGKNYILTETSLTRSPAVITYDKVDNLAVYTSSWDDVISVRGTAAGTATTVHAGDGNDAIAVGKTISSPMTGVTLDSTKGPLSVYGDGGVSNTLAINDTANAGLVGRHYTLTGTSLVRSASPLPVVIGYAGFRGVTLTTSPFDDTIDVFGTAAATMITIFAGDGSDVITVGKPITTPAAGTTLDEIDGPIAVYAQTGVNDQLAVLDTMNTALTGQHYTLASDGLARAGKGPITYGGFNNVLLETGPFDDTVQVLSTAAGTTTTVNAGAGENMLDYSLYANPVMVNLKTGYAGGLSGGISGFQDVTGTAFDDILVGDAGVNHLFGGEGRNVIIGGFGADVLRGGSNDDLLIGGSTVYDSNYGALWAILTEWRSDHSYKDRVNYLLNGGGWNGGYVLNKLNVPDDNAIDILEGAKGTDWFWAYGADKTDRDPGTEKLNWY
jgi:hypothetical protein